jgi:adenylate cyclase
VSTEPAPPEVGRGDPGTDGGPTVEELLKAVPTPTASDLEKISWRVLMGGASDARTVRRIFARLPSAPHCKLCAAPFAGPFLPVFRIMGRSRWPANPNYCRSCFQQLTVYRAGAEIPCSILFADVRGSTSMAEGMRPREFRDHMDRFFGEATRVLVEADAVVDKYVGDEVMALFIPGMAGERHAANAIEAGRRMLRLREHALPIGIGVASGIAFVGAVGAGEKVEMTAMGDTVNVAARLASAAGPGELLVTTQAAEAAGLAIDDLERRSPALKGKSSPTEVVVLH